MDLFGIKNGMDYIVHFKDHSTRQKRLTIDLVVVSSFVNRRMSAVDPRCPLILMLLKPQVQLSTYSKLQTNRLRLKCKLFPLFNLSWHFHAYTILLNKSMKGFVIMKTEAKIGLFINEKKYIFNQNVRGCTAILYTSIWG